MKLVRNYNRRKKLVGAVAVVFLLLGWFSFYWSNPETIHWDVSAIVFSPDGKSVAVGMYRWKLSRDSGHANSAAVNSKIFILNPSNGLQVSLLETHHYKDKLGGTLRTNAWLDYSPDGKRLLVGRATGDTILWDLERNSATPESEVLRALLSVTFSPNGKWIAVLSRPVSELLDAETLEPIAVLDAAIWPRSVSFSPDSKTLAVGSSEGVLLFDVPSGEISRKYFWHSLTGHMFTSLEDERYVQIDEGGSHSLEVQDSGWVAFSPDGDELAVSSEYDFEDCSLRLVDLATQKTTTRVPGIYGPLKFTPDGKELIVASNNELHVFDIASGKERQVLTTNHEVLAFDISPDGELIVAGDNAGHTIGWDLGTGKQLWIKTLNE